MSGDYNILIRPEQSSDWIAIRSLVQEAFAVAEHSNGDEHNLIERIRFTEDYIPQLSLVAEVDGIVVGYVMFSRIYIGNREAVALAPVSVSVLLPSGKVRYSKAFDSQSN